MLPLDLDLPPDADEKSYWRAVFHMARMRLVELNKPSLADAMKLIAEGRLPLREIARRTNLDISLISRLAGKLRKAKEAA